MIFLGRKRLFLTQLPTTTTPKAPNNNAELLAGFAPPVACPDDGGPPSPQTAKASGAQPVKKVRDARHDARPAFTCVNAVFNHSHVTVLWVFFKLWI